MAPLAPPGYAYVLNTHVYEINIIVHSQISYMTSFNLANIFYTIRLRIKTNKIQH